MKPMAKPKPSGSKALKLLASIAPILFIMAAFSTLQVFRLRADRRELAYDKKARMLLLPLLERTRAHLAQAEDYLRLPDPTEARLDQIMDSASQAAVTANHVLSILPESEEATRMRGRAFEFAYRFGDARLDYDKAILLHPQSPARFRLGLLNLRRLARARLTGMETTDKKPEDLADEASEPLRRYQHHPKGTAIPIDEGETTMSLAVDIQTRGLCTLVIAYARGDYKDIQYHAATCRQFDPANWMVPYVEGLSLLERPDPDVAKAAELLASAARFAPALADPHAASGLALHRAGRLAEAGEALTRAIRLDPSFLEAYHLRSQVRFKMGLRGGAGEDVASVARLLLRGARSDSALALTEKGLERHANHPALLTVKAEILLERKDFDGAIREATQAIDANPLEVIALIARGKALLAKGRKTDAARDLERAVELRPALTAELNPLREEAKSP